MPSKPATSTRILTASDLRSLISMEDAVSAVERAFADHALGRAAMPPKVYLSLPEHGGDFRAMPSHVAADGDAPAVAGVKWVNSHAGNPARHGLPAVMGVYILSDPETALPLAILDGTVLTAARTGAAAAVASRHLARPSAGTIGFVGSGVQAEWMLAAHRVVFGDALQVVATDLRSDVAESFARDRGGRAGTLEEACACDIVCTSTPAREPVVRRDMLSPGVHINAMGADAPGKQELESAILRDAVIIIDEHHQATHSGEVNVPLSRGELTDADIFGTLGDIVAGRTRLDRTRDAWTVFDSTGLAIQDVALARVLLRRAEERGVGAMVALVG